MYIFLIYIRLYAPIRRMRGIDGHKRATIARRKSRNAPRRTGAVDFQREAVRKKVRKKHLTGSFRRQCRPDRNRSGRCSARDGRVHPLWQSRKQRHRKKSHRRSSKASPDKRTNQKIRQVIRTSTLQNQTAGHRNGKILHRNAGPPRNDDEVPHSQHLPAATRQCSPHCGNRCAHQNPPGTRSTRQASEMQTTL